VASVAPAPGAAGTSLGPLGPRPGDRAQRLRTRPATATHRLCVSEASPWGDGRSRSLTSTADACGVVASALLPPKPGARLNTARRAAVHLARVARSGARRPVEGPAGDDDARRALTRARAATLSALHAARLRRPAVLLRPALRQGGRAPGHLAPLRGLSAVVWPPPAPPLVLQASGRAVPEHPARPQRLAQARPGLVTSWRLPPVGAALQALRGVQCPGAVPMVAEMGALPRFETPRALLTCLGRLPSEDASAARRQQGAIAHAGPPLPDVAWEKGPGPRAPLPGAVATGNADWTPRPQCSRPSAGTPRSGGVHGPDDASHEAHTPL
jgi:hypothetical protein